jgi:hypothetical protein
MRMQHITLDRVPLYSVLKGLAAGFAKIGGGDGFKPALLVSADGQREIAYLIEDHGDGQVTVMLPSAPTPLSRSVKIVRRERVELLDAKLADVTRVLSHWGSGRGTCSIRRGLGLANTRSSQPRSRITRLMWTSISPTGCSGAIRISIRLIPPTPA